MSEMIWRCATCQADAVTMSTGTLYCATCADEEDSDDGMGGDVLLTMLLILLAVGIAYGVAWTWEAGRG